MRSCEIFVKCNQTQRYAGKNYPALNLYREKSLKNGWKSDSFHHFSIHFWNLQLYFLNISLSDQLRANGFSDGYSIPFG